MTAFETDSDKFITNACLHDLHFESLEFSKSSVVLLVGNENVQTKICLDDVRYIEIKELIPAGIVLSCYSFPMRECPAPLKDEIDFSSLLQYLDDDEIHIFYADGTMGFEFMAAYSGKGSVEETEAQSEIE